MKPLWTGIIWLSGIILAALIALAFHVAQEWLGGKPLPKLPLLLAFLQSHWLAFAVVAVAWAAVLWFAQWNKDRKTSTPDSSPSPMVGGHQATTAGTSSPAFGEVSGGQVFTGPVTFAQPPPTPSPPAPAPQPLHQLLPPPPAFTGREEELADLEKQLASGGGVAISGKHAGLQGMGGVGKTALALVLAHRLKGRFPDAQLFLNLRGADPDKRPPVAPVEAMQHIIHCFQPEARLPETLDALAPIYHSVLSQAGRVLLLLDNAADAGQVHPLLPPPNCLLLVTSRAKINLPGLAARNLDCLPPAKSCELLLKLAPRIKGHEGTAVQLCGHLPLALEVFAGAVKDRSLTPVPELIERLRQRKDKLSPVEAAFQVSFELLAEPLRRRWTLLGVFPAGFHLAAAAAVWEEEVAAARDVMQSLVNASLVETNAVNDRFRLHDLVRQFCEGKLTEAKLSEGARLRHAQHFLDVLNFAAKLYSEKDKSLSGLRLFDQERTDIEAGQRWANANRDHNKEMLKLLAAFSDNANDLLLLRQHPRAERIPWLNASLQASRALHNRRREGAALGNLGLAYVALGETRKAIQFYQQALIIAREVGDRHGEGNALGNLGNAYAALGEPRKAIEFYEQTLAIDREIGDRRGEGSALGCLGIAYNNLGEPRKAIEFHQKHLTIARETGDRHGEGNALGNLGNAYAALGEPRKAIEFYEKQLTIAREIGDRHSEGNALGNIGIGNKNLGEPRKAIEFYEQRLVIAREIGDRYGEGSTLWNSALALHQLGQKAEAVARAEASLAILEIIENPRAAQVRAKLAEWRGQGAA